MPVDKQQNRLEQLDESAEKLQKEELKLKQRDYINHMEKLNDSMREGNLQNQFSLHYSMTLPSSMG